MGFAESTTSPWFSTKSLNAPEMRAGLAALSEHSPTNPLAVEGGVMPNAVDPFALTSVGTSGAPAWSVAPGVVTIQRPVGGPYTCTWDAARTVTVDLPLPASGLTRRDLMVAMVIDPEADSGIVENPNTRLRVYTVPGTPSVSPTAPQVPAGTEPLWEFTVAANGALTGVQSRRRWTRAAGAPRLAEAGDTRPGAYLGDQRKYATGQIDAWLLVGGVAQWVPVVAPTAWNQAAASLYGNGPGAGEFNLGAGGAKIMRYKRVGNDLFIDYEFKWGTSGYNTPGGNIVTYLPNGWIVPNARDQWVPCHLWVKDAVSGVFTDFAGLALVNSNSNIVRPYFPRSNGSGRGATELLPYRAATGAGPGNGIPFIAGGYPIGGALHIKGTLELAA